MAAKQYEVSLPEHGTGERVRRRHERERERSAAARAGATRGPIIRRVGLVAAVVVLVGSIPALSYVGFHALLTSTTGRKLDAVTDPSKAGYEVNVTPTPVEVLAQVDSRQRLSALTILALGADGSGGGVLLVPVNLSVPGEPGAAASTLEATFTAGGVDALGRAVSRAFSFGFDEITVVDDARWASLTAAVGPIGFTNPDRLRTPPLAAGPVELDSSMVGPYLAARIATETEVARLARHAAFWSAWLHAVGASSDPNVLPGEANTGISRFVRGLAKGANEIATLPVGPTASDGSVQIDAGAAAPMLARLVPFPTGAVGIPRIRVRVLDGVGQPGLALGAARALVPAGAEIAIIGNADHYGYTTTILRYNGEAQRAAAEKLRQALGAGTVEQSTLLDDVVDVTIVIGRDLAAGYGAATTTEPATTAGETTSG